MNWWLIARHRDDVNYLNGRVKNANERIDMYSKSLAKSSKHREFYAKSASANLDMCSSAITLLAGLLNHTESLKTNDPLLREGLDEITGAYENLKKMYSYQLNLRAENKSISTESLDSIYNEVAGLTKKSLKDLKGLHWAAVRLPEYQALLDENKQLQTSVVQMEQSQKTLTEKSSRD